MVSNNGALRRVAAVLLLVVCSLCAMPSVLEATDVTVTAVPDYVGVPVVTASSATNITTTSAILHGAIYNTGGTNATVRGFEWGYPTGNYTNSWNQTGNYTIGAFEHEITALTPDSEVFWRAFAVNVHGQGNSTEQSFSTGTALPSAPTNFQIEQTGVSTINITWAKGTGANITIVRGSTDGYPFDISDGDSIYSGNGTYVVVVPLDFTLYTYYYRAWSQNEYGTSTTYAQSSIGHPTDAAVDVLVSLIEGPTGIINIMFAVALMGFAFWKKGWLRVMLSLSLVIWGTFAMQYDVKIAAPFLAVGTLLFILAIFQLITASREAAEASA